MGKHSTLNIQRPTSNIQRNSKVQSIKKDFKSDANASQSKRKRVRMVVGVGEISVAPDRAFKFRADDPRR
jgi:hypothetical protein